MKRTLVHATLSIAVGTLVLACGSTKDTASKGSADAGRGNGSGATSGTGGRSGTGGSSGAGGGAITGCDSAPCTGKKVFGQVLDSCCMDATTCGVQIPQQAGAGAGQCIAVSNIANLPMNAPEGGFFGPPETIVLDPTCPDFMAMGGGGMAFKGCCDKTGVCGAQVTQLQQCLTAADIGAFGGPRGGFDAGPQKACTYPK